jgi:hypothetical protein
MNKLSVLPNSLTRSRGLNLVLTANKARTGITELIAALILQGPLFVVAASEWLPAFELTRIVRRNTIEVREVMNRMRTARASTCYRLFDSLANLPISGEPVLVIDFLHNFYDDDIPLRTRFFKLRECCRELKRLAFYRSIIVLTQELPVEDYEKFLPALFSIADRTIHIDEELDQVKQPALF